MSNRQVLLNQKLALCRTIKAVVLGTAVSMVTAVNAEVIDDKVKTTTVKGATHHTVSNPSVFNGDVRTLPKARKWQPGDPIKVVNPRRINNVQGLLPAVNSPSPDPLIEQQLSVKTPRTATKSAELGFNFSGLGFSGVNPPDPTGEVGLSYYIQSINSANGAVYNIYDKTDGRLVAGNLDMASLHSGDCSTGWGDPIVLFDEQVNRWMLTEFAPSGVNKMCVLISQTSDPISGGWFAYEFQAPSFPDYPKYSQMGGVYYASANENTNAVYAFDRDSMLSGRAASAVRMEIPRLSGFGFNSITPIDVEGTAAPRGTPGMFIRHRDDELHNSGANSPDEDYIELWTLMPDFADPDASVLSGPINVSIAEFDSSFNCPGPGFGCLTQKDSSYTLDPLRETVMYKAKYRNFGSYEAIVGNMLTNAGNNIAALRWFELRRSGNGNWSVHDEGTYTEGDDVSRYMADVGLDKSGNLNLAYMMTGADQYPSIGFTGRLADDPQGRMTFGETVIKQGSGSIESDRNGDYSHMSIDPVDECTMWFTSEFGENGGIWGTQVSSMQIPACVDTSPGFNLAVTELNQEICRSGDLAPMMISASAYNNFNDTITISLSELPSGFAGALSASTLNIGDTVSAQISISEGTEAGEYNFSILGESRDASSKTQTANITVIDQAVSVSLLGPLDDAAGVDYQPELMWQTNGSSGTYLVEIASDEQFTTIVASGEVIGGDTYRPSANLEQETEYFWRVTATNVCGSQASEVFSFTTGSEKDFADPLENGIPSDAFGIDQANFAVFYYIEVPEGATDLVFITEADNGDADLYVAKGARPLVTVPAECRSESYSSNEICEMPEAEPATYYAAVAAYSPFTNLTLTASYNDEDVLIIPVITGQTALEIMEGSQAEINITDLILANIDDPSEVTITILEGENYTIDGDQIIPDENFAGVLTVPLQVTRGTQTRGDGVSEVYNFYISVTPVNDPPVAHDDAVTLAQGSSTSINVTENDTDVDEGDSMSIINVEYTGAGSYNVVGGSITYTPLSDFLGEESLTYTIEDGQGETSQANVTITVTERPQPGVSVSNRSGGSYFSWIFGCLLLPLLAYRRRKIA